jgi:glutamyl-tRNA synthetase
VWVNAVKDKTGRKGKQLFMPLRQAITGMDHGPELAGLLPLIGPDAVKERLKKAA